MTDSTPPERSVDSAPRAGTVIYRCVCGESLEIDAVDGGVCAACNRRFSPAVLNYSGSETMRMPGSDDEDEASTLSGGIGKGSQLGHYKILGRLGHGGMGTVYRALDESLQRFVAVKVIHPLTDDDSQHLDRLVQEARAQARVNHNHVVHIYYVGRQDRTPFFAMELVDGPTLADRLRDERLPFAEVVGIAVQTVEALAQAARFDVVHGDIKPGNILLAEDGSVKLSDFGLSRRLSDRDGSDRIAGTPNYLAPEAIRREPTDIRSDMYSLGVMLFEMTFGRLPYAPETATVEDRLRLHRDASVDFPQPWPDDLPEGWRDVLAKLLQKNPADRYADYDSLLGELKRLQPIALPKAGRLVRGAAWFLDTLLAGGLQALLLLVFDAINAMNMEFLRHLWQATVSVIAALAGAYVQWRWSMTPGKKLLQIRVVDLHGLPPPAAKLAIRSVFQYGIFWSTAMFHTLSLIGLPTLGRLISGAGGVFVLVDAAFALIRRDGRSLHDLLLGTRVALDAPIER